MCYPECTVQYMCICYAESVNKSTNRYFEALWFSNLRRQWESSRPCEKMSMFVETHLSSHSTNTVSGLLFHVRQNQNRVWCQALQVKVAILFGGWILALNCCCFGFTFQCIVIRWIQSGWVSGSLWVKSSHSLGKWSGGFYKAQVQPCLAIYCILGRSVALEEYRVGSV